MARQPRDTNDRRFGLVAALLGLLSPGPGVWAQGPGQPADDPRPRRAAPGRAVVVHQGQLSVDVQAADLGEVLAQIGRQAGLRIVAGPSAGTRVSARFAGVALDEGLRRLLRLASLSHLFRYAPGPAGTVTLTEVHVVGAGPDTLPRPAPATDRGFSAASQAPEPVPDVGEAAPEPPPDPGRAAPGEAMRRVLDAFTRSKQRGASPPDGHASPPHEPQHQGNE
jgi:hypothetical protein